jgi:microcystin degradation protein MlrC
MVFGSLVMTDHVLDQDWMIRGDRGVALLQVSTFLAGFSGLYITVSTVTDETYREQFFGHVLAELERAIGVRAVYLTLRGADPSG